MRILIGVLFCCAGLLLPAGAQGLVRAELAPVAGPVQISLSPGGQPQGWPAGLTARNVSAHRI